MGDRKTSVELASIKKKFNVNDIYSWSKYHTYKQDSYTYFLKYIKRIPEDRCDSIYAPSGGLIHQILQDLYEGKIKYEQMLEQYESGLLELNLIDLKNDRGDEEKNKKIAEKYEYCIRHFFQNHNSINKKIEIERFITIFVKPFLFQGYCDAIYIEDGFYKILDWKSATIYTGAKILSESGQLCLYAEALRQMGIPLEKIKAYWNFIKYVTVESPQANGKISVRNIERNEIGNKLAASIKMWMKKSSYAEDDIDSYISTVSLTNSLDCLPEDIKSKYKISDCYVEVPLSEEIIDDLKKDIVETIIEISKKEVEYRKTEDDDSVWYQEVNDENSFFFNVLGSYSTKWHRPLREYYEMKDMFKNKKEKEADEDDDLSWLNEL
jgi:RecB family exonuclease